MRSVTILKPPGDSPACIRRHNLDCVSGAFRGCRQDNPAVERTAPHFNMSNKGIVLLFISISGMILLFVYSRDTVFLKRRECVPVRPTDGNQDQTLDFTPRPTVVNDQRSDETLSIRDGATVQLRKNARIMCWIPSVESQLLKKVKAVNDTWVRRCDGHVFFVNTSIQLPDVKNLNVPDGRQHLTAKSMQAFEYLYHHHLQDYDWFLKGDDDAYIVLENLRLLMSQYDPAKPVYLGHLYKSHLKAGYMSGGASYALSREALRLLHDEGIVKEKCTKDNGHEDVEVGKCLHTAGVDSHNTVDIFGRESFHPLTPSVHINGPIPSNQIPQDRFLMVSGRNCCSELTISFHHMSPELIRIFDFLLYRVSVFGRVPDLAFLEKLYEAKTIPPLV